MANRTYLLVKAIHRKDLSEGYGRVPMPGALDRKYPNASKEWRWQWIFPQEKRRKNTKTGQEGRHHIHETVLQRAVKQAVCGAGVVKRAGCHTFRHSFATHLLEGGMTSELYRNCSGTKTSTLPWFTPTFWTKGAMECAVGLMTFEPAYTVCIITVRPRKYNCCEWIFN